MVIIREISKGKYIIAAVITIGIFLFGLLLGLVIEGKRLSYIESVSKQENLEYNSLQLQYAFMDQLSKEENCDAVSKTFEDNIKTLESARERLESFNANSKLNKNEFKLLKRDYVLAQVRYWLLARRTKEICKNDMATILYFYSDDKECPECGNQAFVLDYLKKLFKDKLLIFSFDAKQENEPLISIFKHTYNITRYPALVIVGQKFDGLMDKNMVLGRICPHYKNETSCYGYMPVKNESQPE